MTSWIPVAQASDVPPGRVLSVPVGDLEVAVCNVDGTFYAIDDVCTHDGGALDQGELEGNEIECPRHGARFDVRTGGSPSYPPLNRSKRIRCAWPAIRSRSDWNLTSSTDDHARPVPRDHPRPLPEPAQPRSAGAADGRQPRPQPAVRRRGRAFRSRSTAGRIGSRASASTDAAVRSARRRRR